MLGTAYISKGAKRLVQPGLKCFVVLPVLLNIALYAALFGYTFTHFEGWLDALLPSWLSWLSWILWPLMVAMLFLFLSYTFVLMANIVGAPFHALLAEEVEKRVRQERGETIEEVPFNWGDCVKTMIGGVVRTFAKLLYTLPRLIVVLIISVIPAVNVISPALWVMLGGWMYSLEYWDWAAENNQRSLKESVQEMKAHRVELFGFGVSVYVLAMIPIVNLVIVPIAVAGGVELWLAKHPQAQTGA